MAKKTINQMSTTAATNAGLTGTAAGYASAWWACGYRAGIAAARRQAKRTTPKKGKARNG